jgi:hypothetical protein
MTTVLAEFDAYLARDGANPVGDMVGFRQHRCGSTMTNCSNSSMICAV